MGKCLDTALDALSRRALTVLEVEMRLERKAFSREEIADTLARLLEWGYLDDRRLAVAYAKNRASRYSQQRIRQELIRRGVDRALADKALQCISEEDEMRQCLQVAEKLVAQEERHKNMGKSGWSSARQRIGAKLLQRGYRRDMVLRVLDNFYKSD